MEKMEKIAVADKIVGTQWACLPVGGSTPSGKTSWRGGSISPKADSCTTLPKSPWSCPVEPRATWAASPHDEEKRKTRSACIILLCTGKRFERDKRKYFWFEDWEFRETVTSPGSPTTFSTRVLSTARVVSWLPPRALILVRSWCLLLVACHPSAHLLKQRIPDNGFSTVN